MHDPVNNLSTRLNILINNIQCDNKRIPLFPEVQVDLHTTTASKYSITDPVGGALSWQRLDQ